MHRIMRPCRSMLGGLFFALLVGLSLPSSAEAQIPTPSLPQINLPLGSTMRFQMSTKRKIAQVFTAKRASLGFVPLMITKEDGKEEPDRTTLLITGLVPDIARVEFTDDEGHKELVEFMIQLDLEFVRYQLKRAVPSANIQITPTSGNTVLLTGTVAQPQEVDLVARVVTSVGNLQVINAIRVGGVQQVQLDVVIAQVSRREFRRMAFDFLVNSQNFFFGSTVGQAVQTPASFGTAGALGVASSGLTGLTGGPNGANTNIVAGVLHSGWGILMFLQALRDEGLVKTLAEPRMVTLSGRPGSFISGGEQAIPVPAGLGQVGVQFVEFGTRLNVLPIVLGNGKIHLEVEPEISALDPTSGTSINGTIVPGRTTSRVNTTVQLEPGQTFVIGGLIQHTLTASTRKTPVLGDMPFFGSFFSSKSFDEQEVELVILVTPHLVDGQDCSQLPKTLPGQETRSPDDFELFLECILEAPRGPRKVFNGNEYVPAYMNGASAGQFPCAGGAAGACAVGGGTTGVSARVSIPAMPVTGPSAIPMVVQPTPTAALGNPLPLSVARPTPQAILPMPPVQMQPHSIPATLPAQSLPLPSGPTPSPFQGGPVSRGLTVDPALRQVSGPVIRSSPSPALPPGID